MMEYDDFYVDLFERLNSLCKKIAEGRYDKPEADALFELAKKSRYPALLAELAESFGLMMVKVEARDFKLQELTARMAMLKESSDPSASRMNEASSEEPPDTSYSDSEQLKDALETARALCHELSQPLQTISGNAELALMDLSQDHASHSNVHRIRSEVDRLGSIISQLSDVTRRYTKS